MKKLLFLPLWFLLVSTSFSHCLAQIGVSDTCHCPIPVGDTGGGFGPRIPAIGDMEQRLSPDGTKLVYYVDQGDGGIYWLDFATRRTHAIVPAGGLPAEQDLGLTELTFCPYDPDLAAMTVSSGVDTIGGIGPNVYVRNLFTYRFSTEESKLITPDVLRPYGAFRMSLKSWSPGSFPGHDTLSIAYEKLGSYSNPVEIVRYEPQTQEMQPDSIPKPVEYTFRHSHDMRDSVWVRTDSNGLNIRPYFLNDIPLNFPHPIDTSKLGQGIFHVTFSPDDKLVAYDIDAYPHDSEQWAFRQVWVSTVLDPAHPLYEINFQKLWCTYSLWGIYPEFITDSTLAVSMHKDGDSVSPLWEITINGRLVRQLTELPSQAVAEAPPSAGFRMVIWPTVVDKLASVRLAQSGTKSEFSVTNELGSEVIRKEVAAHSTSFDFDMSELPNGFYFCSLTRAGSEDHAKILVRH